jgi:BMFP domain-containing protein YqiC
VVPDTVDELGQLRARVAELEAQLRVQAVRTEVAAILPHTAAAAEKKTPSPRPSPPPKPRP